MKRYRLLAALLILVTVAVTATPAFAADPNPGQGTSEVFVMNTDSAATTTVTAEYYNQDGSFAVSVDAPLNVLGSAKLLVTGAPGLPDNWTGSMILSSTTDVASVATIHWTGGGGGGDGIEASSYEGFPEGATKMYMPYAVYGPNSQYTVITVQNTGSVQASISMKYYNRDGTLDFTIPDTIPADGQKMYDLHIAGAKIPVWTGSAWYNSHGNWSGAILIETGAGDQMIAAVANNFWMRYSIAYKGATAGNTKVFVPAVARRDPLDHNFFGVWLEHTIIAVQNLGSVPTNVRLTYVDAYGVIPNLVTPDLTAPANAGLSFNTRAGDSVIKDTFYPLGATWSGSVIVESIGTGGNPAQPLAVVSYSIRPRDNEAGGASGVSTLNAGVDTFLPEIYQKGGSGNARTLWSFFHIQNVTNEQATVTVKFLNRDGTVAFTNPDIILDGEKGVKLNMRGTAVADLGGNFEGAAYVHSTKPISVVVDNLWALAQLATFNGYSK